MKRTYDLLSMGYVVALVLCAAGCSDSPCDSWHGRRGGGPADLRALVPPGAEVCGSSTDSSLRFDIERPADILALVRPQAESQGYTLVEAQESVATFARDGQTYHVSWEPSERKGTCWITMVERY